MGIKSREQLKELGAVAVDRRLSKFYSTSKTMLWALRRALLDLTFCEISPAIEAALLGELAFDSR